MGPTHAVFKTQMSVWFRSNAFLVAGLSGSFGVWPYLPYTVMNTLAFVPPFLGFPVTVTISYSVEQKKERKKKTHNETCI